MKGFYNVYDNWGQEITGEELSEALNNVVLKVPGVYFIRIHAEGSFIVKKVIFERI